MNSAAKNSPLSPVQEVAQAVGPARDWEPGSWKNFPALQQATYPDPIALDAALKTLGRLPPLVTSWEILALREQIAEAQEGRRFVLQGGDCAESFDEVCASPWSTACKCRSCASGASPGSTQSRAHPTWRPATG
jgi:hypothetical protein